jgi:hypothetical protein
MWTRLGLCVAAACIIPVPVAADQSAETLVINDDCLACHGDADSKRPRRQARTRFGAGASSAPWDFRSGWRLLR